MMNSSPEVEESMEPMRLSMVVLPPPEGPLIITNSPLNEVSKSPNKLYLLLHRIKLLVCRKGYTF